LIVTSNTILVLFGIVFWYHYDGILATYEVTSSLSQTSAYVLALFVGLPVLLSWPTIIGTIISTALLQINTWLLLCYRREFSRAIGSKRSSVVGFGGFIAGVFGIGCSACGTTLLVGALGTISGIPILSFLPWHGTELMVLGIGVMSATTVFLVKQLTAPKTCVST
jgi:hypothetical protein